MKESFDKERIGKILVKSEGGCWHKSEARELRGWLIERKKSISDDSPIWFTGILPGDFRACLCQTCAPTAWSGNASQGMLFVKQQDARILLQILDFDLSKVKIIEHIFIGNNNPDFSEWQHFGRLLKIARAKNISVVIKDCYISRDGRQGEIIILHNNGNKETSRFYIDIDQIPALVATELARVIEEGK